MSQHVGTPAPAAPRSVMVWLTLVAVVFIGLATPSHAAEPKVFEVRGVKVDVTADTASDARDQAVAEGARTAFRTLLERLTIARDHDRLPDLSQDEIQNYILDFSVEEEKSSAVRYLGTLDFRFKPQEIRKLLIAYNIPFAETLSKPVLVVPVIRQGGTAALWDEGNPWYKAWAAQPANAGLLPIVLPLGDLQDMSTLPVDAAIAGDTEKLLATAGRLDAGDALVAIATVGNVGGTPSVQVEAHRYGSVESAAQFSLQAQNGETLAALLQRAAKETRARIADEWKRLNLLDYGRAGVLAVTVPVATLGDWLQVRHTLRQIPVVRNAEPILISTQEVRVNLHYVGDADQLITALQQADLSLTQEGGEWILVPAGALPGQG